MTLAVMYNFSNQIQYNTFKFCNCCYLFTVVNVFSVRVNTF